MSRKWAAIGTEVGQNIPANPCNVLQEFLQISRQITGFLARTCGRRGGEVGTNICSHFYVFPGSGNILFLVFYSTYAFQQSGNEQMWEHIFVPTFPASRPQILARNPANGLTNLQAISHASCKDLQDYSVPLLSKLRVHLQTTMAGKWFLKRTPL